MTTETITPKTLRDLRRRERVADLKLSIAEKTATLKAIGTAGAFSPLTESCYDPDNYVDIRDYIGYPGSKTSPTARASINDRMHGRNVPVFQSEAELAEIRGVARVLCDFHPNCIGVMNNLTNYVIGTGFSYTAGSKTDAADALVADVQDVVDEFLDDNDFGGDLDRELFWRTRRDGEAFPGLWHVGDGHVELRSIEPDQVTEPGAKRQIEDWLGCDADNPSCWSFGVHSDERDTENTHGYYVQWSPLATDWDYMPGGKRPYYPPGSPRNTWCEHAKVNVDRKIKRGVSDFFATRETFELARKLLRNTGEGGAVQAAIAFIREHSAGTTQTQIEAMRTANAYSQYIQPTRTEGSRTRFVHKYEPGTIIDVARGQEYKPGPMGSQRAPNFIQIVEALLRSVAVRWSMPEHMVTGSAENNNYASILEAGAPFTKACEAAQQFYVSWFSRIVWKVLWFAWRAGRFGRIAWRDFSKAIEVQVEPPEVAVRDGVQETNRRSVLFDKGVLSAKTWAGQEGLDYEQEQTNGVAPKPAEATGPAPATAGIGTAAPRLSESAVRLFDAAWKSYP